MSGGPPRRQDRRSTSAHIRRPATDLGRRSSSHGVSVPRPPEAPGWEARTAPTRASSLPWIQAGWRRLFDPPKLASSATTLRSPSWSRWRGLGYPFAALTQVARRSDVGAVGCFDRVLEATLEARDPTVARDLFARALELTLRRPIDNDYPDYRNMMLGQIAELIAQNDPTNPEAIDRAVELANTIGRDWDRDAALAQIAELIAQNDPTNPEAIDQAVELANTIGRDWHRCEALAGIARRMAAADRPRATELMIHALDLFDSTPESTSAQATFREPGGRWKPARSTPPTPRSSTEPSSSPTPSQTAGSADGRWRPSPNRSRPAIPPTPT